MRSRHTVDVSRAPMVFNPRALPTQTAPSQPMLRPRSTVSVTRIGPDSAKPSFTTPMSAKSSFAAAPTPMPAKSSFTTLPMITESCFCDGMKEISGGVYEDGSHKSVGT